MVKSHTKITTSNTHITARSLIAHSQELVYVHVRMFAAYRYDPVIYACVLPTVFCHGTWI